MLQSYYLCFGVYFCFVGVFYKLCTRTQGNIQKSHVFMEICHLTVVLGDLIRCRENLLPSEFWLSTLYIRKHIRPGGFWRQSMLKKTIEKASIRTGQNEMIKLNDQTRQARVNNDFNLLC